MKTILTALAGAAILTAPLPALAQSHHGGGSGVASAGDYHGGAGAGARSAYGARTGYAGGRYGGGHYAGGYHGYRGGYAHYRGYGYRGGYPYYAGGLGLGIALGLSAAAYDPWYYDTPFYGYSEVVTVDHYGPPPPAAYDDGPPPAAAGPAPACGSWSWDPARQVYNWIPC